MDSKHRGGHSELIASAWLLSQGFEVFRNVSAHGLADLVAFNTRTNETTLVDVKTASSSKYTNKGGGVTSFEYACPKRTPDQIRSGVKILVVARSGECMWVGDAPHRLYHGKGSVEAV